MNEVTPVMMMSVVDIKEGDRVLVQDPWHHTTPAFLLVTKSGWNGHSRTERKLVFWNQYPKPDFQLLFPKDTLLMVAKSS